MIRVVVGVVFSSRQAIRSDAGQSNSYNFAVLNQLNPLLKHLNTFILVGGVWVFLWNIFNNTLRKRKNAQLWTV